MHPIRDEGWWRVERNIQEALGTKTINRNIKRVKNAQLTRDKKKIEEKTNCVNTDYHETLNPTNLY